MMIRSISSRQRLLPNRPHLSQTYTFISVLNINVFLSRTRTLSLSLSLFLSLYLSRSLSLSIFSLCVSLCVSLFIQSLLLLVAPTLVYTLHRPWQCQLQVRVTLQLGLSHSQVQVTVTLRLWFASVLWLVIQLFAVICNTMWNVKCINLLCAFVTTHCHTISINCLIFHQECFLCQVSVFFFLSPTHATVTGMLNTWYVPPQRDPRVYLLLAK